MGNEGEGWEGRRGRARKVVNRLPYGPSPDYAGLQMIFVDVAAQSRRAADFGGGRIRPTTGRDLLFFSSFGRLPYPLL